MAIAAAALPVIIVNISHYGSDAILILVNQEPIVVPLPKATPAAIQNLLESLDKARGMDRTTDGVRMDASFRKVLHGLWKQIAFPVVEALRRDLELPRGSRICWCPTSNLWMLPLHAAGSYKPGQENLPDMFVSSYTPTLSVLRQFTAEVPAPPGKPLPPGVLFVGQSDTEGQSKLEFVEAERLRMQTYVPGVQVLEGGACTDKAVLSALRDHSWVHFACHAEQDPSQPFRSRLILHNSGLHLLDIVKERQAASRAELAVLSACHSAAGDRTTPDEVLHLAAGMQFAGFRSVVGTMWESDDRDAPDIAGRFYEYMFSSDRPRKDCRFAAEALAYAVQGLRKEAAGDEVPFERWLNYVHFGV